MEVVSHVIVKSFNVVIVFFFSLDHVPLKNGAEFFGSGLDQIWLDNLVCNGDESSLLECNTNSIGQHNCDQWSYMQWYSSSQCTKSHVSNYNIIF